MSVLISTLQTSVSIGPNVRAQDLMSKYLSYILKHCFVSLKTI